MRYSSSAKQSPRFGLFPRAIHRQAWFVNVRQAILKQTDALKAVGIDSPQLDCELLLEHVLGKPRIEFYMEPELILSEIEARRFAGFVARRVKRVPLQHLVGTVSFCGLEIHVNRHVLIPRPETEQLAEEAIRVLVGVKRPRVLDFGTGSGCLAIAIAVENQEAQIDALDLSARALDVAGSNARRHRVASRIRFLQGDGKQGLPGRVWYHVIVANPPYIPSAEIDHLQPEVRDHDPRLALDGGNDGLEFYRILAERSRRRLKQGGQLLLETGDDQAKDVKELLTSKNWSVDNILPDLNGTSRIVIASLDEK